MSVKPPKSKVTICHQIKEERAPKASAPLQEKVIYALRQVFDPELPVNVYDLGLIYDILVENEADVAINMTLTAPNCPVADKIVQDVDSAVRGVEGVQAVKVTLVWTPQWTKDRMSEAAKVELGFF